MDDKQDASVSYQYKLTEQQHKTIEAAAAAYAEPVRHSFILRVSATLSMSRHPDNTVSDKQVQTAIAWARLEVGA